MADRVPYRSPRSKPSAGFGKRLVWILVVGLITAAVISLTTGGNERRTAIPPPTPEPMADMPARKLQSHACDNAVAAGAAAAQEALAQARLNRGDAEDPHRSVHISTTIGHRRGDGVSMSRIDAEEGRGKPSPAIQITGIRSRNPHSTQAKALNDALEEARIQIAEQLEALDEPIRHVPSVEEVRNKYMKTDSVAVIPVRPDPQTEAELKSHKIDPNRVWVEIDVALTADQVRELRSASRVESSAPFGIVVLILVAALFGFLRLDAWTKGYLTAGIGIAVAAAAGGALALVFLS